jgi:hypothetical protein
MLARQNLSEGGNQPSALLLNFCCVAHCIIQYNNEQSVQECDATKLHSYSSAWYKIKNPAVNTSGLIIQTNQITRFYPYSMLQILLQQQLRMMRQCFHQQCDDHNSKTKTSCVLYQLYLPVLFQLQPGVS